MNIYCLNIFPEHVVVATGVQTVTYIVDWQCWEPLVQPPTSHRTLLTLDNSDILTSCGQNKCNIVSRLDLIWCLFEHSTKRYILHFGKNCLVLNFN